MNFEGDRPIFLVIAERIEDGILSGAYEEETQVPSTNEISVAFQINPATVLKGITLLVDEGTLYKKRGIGMFVQKGAQAGILRKRRDGFVKAYVAKLVEEAAKLGVSKQELIEMIEKELSS